MGFGSKKEESKSPLEAIVGSFTTNAEKINSFLGFPGVLLLFSIMLFTTTALPTTPEGGIYLLGVGAVISLFGSVASYLIQWYFALKTAQEQTSIMREYIKLFLSRYLESQEKVGAEQIKYAMEEIVLKLTKSDVKLNGT